MERQAQWYDEFYKGSLEYKKEPKDSIYRHVWDKALFLIHDEKVVDLGCGSGQFAKLLLNNGKTFVCGIDFSSEAIAIAQKLNPEHKEKFIVGNLLGTLNLPEYDLAVCFEVLEHIVKDLDVINKIEPGSRFIFSVPNFNDQAHVRKFNSETQIIKRYSELIDIYQIFRLKTKRNNTIFLVDSMRYKEELC